jgi:hypothetical protein
VQVQQDVEREREAKRGEATGVEYMRLHVV